jgi:proline-specific peptidase
MSVPTQVAVNGIELHVEEFGTGDPPLVLVHGYTGSSVDWADVAPELASDRRVIVYDHRGHGQSTNTRDLASYSFDQLVADFAALVDALGLETFDLLGHSMGGIVAMRYILEHPERVRSLVLMDTGAAPASEMPTDMLDGLAAKGREEGMDAVFESIKQFTQAALDQLRERDPARADVMATRGRLKFTQLDPDGFSALGRELGRYPSMVERLKAITCPTTVLVGANDTGLLAAAEVMAKEIPGAQHVVIDDAGHSPQEDQPKVWLDAVRAHLDRAIA